MNFGDEGHFFRKHHCPCLHLRERQFGSDMRKLYRSLWIVLVGLWSAHGIWVLAAGELREVPLVSGEDAGEVTMAPEWRWRALSGKAALEEGLPALAASFLRQVIEQSTVPESNRTELKLDFLTALLGSRQLAEAEELLPKIDSDDEGIQRRVAMRAAWLAYLQGDPQRARTFQDALHPDQFPPADRPWMMLLQALLRHASGDFEAANLAFAAAVEAAPTEGLRHQFELVRLQGELVAGEASQEVVAELRMAARALRGRVGEAEASRLLAVALARLGRGDEALSVIEQELQRPGISETERRFDFLLLVALISGDESGRGRVSLAQILSSTAPAETQRLALGLLSRAPFEGRFRGEFLSLMGDLLEATRPHPLQDEMLGLRAILLALEGRFDEAETDAERLIDSFPGSSLVASMHRLLAYVNWRREPPRYRTAASHLNQVRSLSDTAEERYLLTVLMGDCYFLNGDYLNASEAYGSALRGLEGPDRSPVLFQQVLSEILAGRLDAAVQVLDAYSGEQGMRSTLRWKAEWNLLNALRDEERTEEAFRRMRSLLSTEGRLHLPPELEIRIGWLEARLTFEAGRASETPSLVDSLIEMVESHGGEGRLSSEERAAVLSHGLLLKGEALLALGQRSEAMVVFGELRSRFPDSGPDMLSYLIEARVAAGENSIVDAQASLVSLADRFPESRYAPIALWEAALQVEQRGLDSGFREAVSILERLLQTYPDSPLAYYARLKQADLSRRLNDFGTALALYDRLIARYPDHPERFRAELSRADSLMARGGGVPESMAAASVVYERLLLDQTIPLDARIEAGFKWGNSLLRRNLTQGAREAYYMVKRYGLDDSERAARLGSQGRYWMARTLLELAALDESAGDLEGFANARGLYQLLLTAGLPGAEIARNRLEQLGEPAG